MPATRAASVETKFEVLESKLLPPPGRGGSVSRDGLVSLLEEAADATPIVLVSAGPGWGKTTLLTQWAARSQRPFAWISLDQRDNNPMVLLTYVAFALDRVVPLDGRVFAALESPGSKGWAEVVSLVGAALARSDQPVVLVLDNLHLLDNPVCLDALAAVATQVPAGSQLALSVRSRPALPPAGPRGPETAFEIGEQDLRLDQAGARLVLSEAGLALPDDQVAELAERAEGWPAGLHLAALSIRGRGGTAKAADTFAGSDRLVSDYLQSELLAHLSSEDFRFLTRTAVLERMSGALCDAVLETSGSGEILEWLARSNLFLVPLDAKGEWFRYHHLVRELLRSELTRAEPDVVPTLLGRAAEWCEASGHPETAIGYAQQAGDVARAARLVERCAHPAYASGRVETVERWVHWLEAHGALEENAALAVLGGLFAPVWGRPAEAQRWAELAERASYDGILPDGSPSIGSWLALLRAQHCQGGVARMRTEAEFALRTLAAGSVNRPTAMLLLATSLWLAGEVDPADDLFADVAEEGLERGSPEAAALALGQRAAIAIARGAWVQAEEFADRALRVVRRAQMSDYPTGAFLHALGARLALRRGQTSRAHESLGLAQRLRPGLTYALPYLAVQARLELGRAYLTIFDIAGARTMLREIDALLRRQPDLGTLPSEVEELRSSLLGMRPNAPGASTLTEAELRLVSYLGTHLSFREVGERLYISRNTVKSHAMSVYRKLNVSSRNRAVERAKELGLL